MMKDNPLGKNIEISHEYSPEVLFPIPRSVNREINGIDEDGLSGFDLWNAFELSWLGPTGRPEVRICRIVYSADSENIVESKSLKLYFFSFSMTRFESEDEVVKTIRGDLEKLLKTPFIRVYLYPYSHEFKFLQIDKKHLIDNLELNVSVYKIDPRQLKLAESGKGGTHELYTNLLKSNCPVTGQPDWATVYVKYRGESELDRAGFLKYIISFREHSDYHEACCEKIFHDLKALLKPESLLVKCFFTRRGGIEINPVRYSGMKLSLDELFSEERVSEEYDGRFWRQ